MPPNRKPLRENSAEKIAAFVAILGAATLALVSLVDAGRNLLLILGTDDTGPIVPSAVAGAVAVVALVAAAWVLRRPLGELAGAIGAAVPGSSGQYRALLFVFVMVSSVAVMPLLGGLGGGTVEANTATIQQSETPTLFVAEGNALSLRDKETGNELNTVSLGSDPLAVEYNDQKTVYVGLSNGDVAAVNITSASIDWTASVGGTAPSIAYHDGNIFAAATNSTAEYLTKINASGNVTAKAPLNSNSNAENDLAVGSGPSGYIHAVDENSDIYRLETSDLSFDWNKTDGPTVASNHMEIEWAGEGLVVAGGGNNIVGVESETGGSRFERSVANTVRSISAGPGDEFFVAEKDPIAARDPQTGEYVYNITSGDKWGDDYGLVADGSSIWAIEASDNQVRRFNTSGSTNYTFAHSQSKSYSPEMVAVSGEMPQKSLDAVSGTVQTQNDNPVAGATVAAWGVAEPALDTSDARSLEQQAEDLQAELQNPLPSSWNPDLDLSDHTDRDSATYALVHQENDWGSGRTTIIDSEIGDPRLTVDGERDVLISLWDASEEPTGPIASRTQGPVDNSHTGELTSGTVVIEQLSGTGETLETRKIDTSAEFETKRIGRSNIDHPAVRTSLPEGVYRAYPESNSGAGYVFTVGEPDSIASSIEDDLRDEANQLTDRAQRVRDMLNNEEIVRRTTTTDANGSFSVDMPSNVVSADVKAMKADGTQLEGVTDPSLEDLREIQTGGYNGSFYIPSPTPNTVEPPAENVTVTTYRTPELPMSDMESFADLQAFLQQQRLNETVSDLRTEYEQRLADMERDSLERVYQNHRTLVETVPNAENEYLSRSDFEEIQDAGDLSTGELETETRHMQLAVANAGSIDAPDVPDDAVDVSDGELEFEYPLPDSVDADTVAPELHWSNGETEQIPEEYYSVESRGLAGQNDVLVISGLPIDDTDPAAFDIRVQAASGGDDGLLGGGDDGGVLDDRVSATNPAFSGMVPEIGAVEFSTLAPGSSETVYVGLDAASGSGYGQLVAADAFGPDGSEINATVDTERDRASFETDGVGAHYVRLTYESESGDQFVLAERVRALENPGSEPATIRTSESATGTHAIIGEQLDSARVETERGTATFTAVVPGDETIGGLHIKPGDALETSSTTFDVQVVEGAAETAIQSNIPVSVHLDRYPESAIAWRNGEPVVQSGETRFGQVERPEDNPEKGVLRTYTDASGQATIELDRDPGRVDRLSHWMAYNVPVPDIPFLSLFGGGSALIGGLGLAWTRRRRTGAS